MKQPEVYINSVTIEYLMKHDPVLATVAPQDIEKIYSARKKAGLLPVEMYDIPKIIGPREISAALNEISKLSFGCAKLDIATLIIIRMVKDMIDPTGTVRPCGCGQKLSDPS